MTKKHDSFAKFLMNSTDTVKELIGIYFGIILLCSGLFVYFEAIAFKDAIWMAFVTATTTGYGDFFPKTTGGRMVAVFLMHTIAFVIAPLLIYRFIDAVDQNDFTDKEQEELKRKQNWIVEQLEIQTGRKYEPEQAS